MTIIFRSSFCGRNGTTQSERNATFPLQIATICHMH
jgi:hypothetical protein